MNGGNNMKHGKKITRKIIQMTLSAAMLLVFVLNSYTVVTAEPRTEGTIAYVSTFEDLKAALEDNNVTEVVVEDVISLSEGTVLDGCGKTVRTANPYITEMGTFDYAGDSNYRVFDIESSANVKISNMTIIGGAPSFLGAVNVNSGAKLTMDNVTVTRSYRGVNISGATVIMTNCNIVRNIALNGGGILCDAGILIMDGCSLSENRSVGPGYGGGAMEIKGSGKLYANNLVIANNCSSEIGGAINCYTSYVYLMNSAVTGNVTTCKYGAHAGAGIGVNTSSRGGLYAVNCYLADNYHIYNNVPTPSDIGLWSSNNTATLINCVYNSVAVNGDATNLTTRDCKNNTANSATGYRNDGILSLMSDTTDSFVHPILLTKENNSNALYVPVSPSGSAASGGIVTYFEYSDPANVKMSYGESTSLGDLPAAGASFKVTKYYEGSDRDFTDGSNIVIGASGPLSGTYYTVKLGSFSNGSVSGATRYGDSYADGQTVTLQADAGSGYIFTEWKKDGAEDVVSTDNPYTFPVTSDIALVPVFTPHTHSWAYIQNENAIEAYCTSSETQCSYYGTEESHTNTLKLILNVNDKTYSGSAYQGAVIENNITSVTGAAVGSITYVGRENTAYDEYTVAPTNVGKYTAKILLGGVTATADFEITPLSVAKPEANTSTFTYNGTEQTYTLTESDWYTVSGNKRTVSGSQQVIVALTDKTNTVWEDNTTEDLTFTFSISKANQSGVAVIMDNYTYGQNVSTNSLSGDMKESPYITYYYNTTGTNTEGTEWKDISSTTLEPGDYYMYAVLGETNNYIAFTTPVTAFKVIGQDMGTITAEDVVKTYDGKAYGIEVTGYPDGATVVYGTTEGVYDLADCPTYKDASADSHTIYYKVTKTGCNPVTGSATVTINPLTVELSWGETAFTYNGIEQAPSAAVTNLIAGDSCNVTITGGKTDSNAKAGVDNYTATAAILSNGNYKLPETGNAIEFTISKKEITVSPKTVTITEGEELPAIELEYTGLVGNDVITPEKTPVFVYKDKAGNTVDGTTAGTYAIVWSNIEDTTFKDADNYKVAAVDGTLTVTHVHKVVTDAAVQATCTTTGLTEGKHCSVCGEILVAQQTIAALGHDWGEWKVVKEATETEEGKAERECTRCGEKEEKNLPVLGHTHTAVTDEAVAATCTTTGLTEGSHCSVCGEILVAQQTIDALGHDWSGEWKVVKEATATEDGKRETYCTRGCGQKKVEVIPAIGSEDEGDTNGGAIQKDAEVAKDAPINEATLDNKKSELLNAVKIFTAEEKSAIENGKDARVWLEVTRTDENSIAPEDKVEVKKAAEEIMGENPDIIYFDADLFKQVEGSEKTQLHEPGIDINVTIKIPDELLNHDSTMAREYKIIRLHKDAATGAGNVEVLGGSFNAATGEFTFATDKFSTYAIAYNDVPVEDSTIIPVTGIVISSEGAAITGAGETVQLTVAVSPLLATDRSVSWVSSDTGVATVDATGKVTAVGNGTCTITATTNDGHFSVVCTVTVNIQSDNGNDVSGGNGSTGNSESGSTDSGSTAGNGTGSSESGSTGVDESGSGNAGNTGNTGTDVNTGDGQITAPSTGGEGASGRMVPIAVFMMLALAGAATVIAVYSRKKRVVR